MTSFLLLLVQSSLVPSREAMQRCSLSICVKMIPYECQMHDKTRTGYRKSIHQWFIPFRASGKRQGDAHSSWATYSAKPCCYCWLWSTQRCPARTQYLSWWAGSGHPRRSASGRMHTWSTPDGKLCPAHASSSQMLESSSHRKHRDRPDRKAWEDEEDISIILRGRWKTFREPLY